MTDRSRLAVGQKEENDSRKDEHFYDREGHAYLSSVSFIRVVPWVEKTIKDILSCGLERKRNSIRANRKTVEWHSHPGFLPALPFILRLSKRRTYNPRGSHHRCKHLASRRLETMDRREDPCCPLGDCFWFDTTIQWVQIIRKKAKIHHCLCSVWGSVSLGENWSTWCIQKGYLNRQNLWVSPQSSGVPYSEESISDWCGLFASAIKITCELLLLWK